MLQLEPRHYQIIQQILNKYPYQFYAYGSRSKNTARRLSDLDLCYLENIPGALAFQIEEELKESNLPFIVELVSWNHMRPAFREMIKKDLVLIKTT